MAVETNCIIVSFPATTTFTKQFNLPPSPPEHAQRPGHGLRRQWVQLQGQQRPRSQRPCRHSSADLAAAGRLFRTGKDGAAQCPTWNPAAPGAVGRGGTSLPRGAGNHLRVRPLSPGARPRSDVDHAEVGKRNWGCFCISMTFDLIRFWFCFFQWQLRMVAARKPTRYQQYRGNHPHCFPRRLVRLWLILQGGPCLTIALQHVLLCYLHQVRHPPPLKIYYWWFLSRVTDEL